MKIFETDRLIVRSLNIKDADAYFDMMGNPNVTQLIPSPTMTRLESDTHLRNFISLDHSISEKKIWGITEKDSDNFIGLCAFLINNENADEIGYRFREQYWSKGYGTEIAKGLISYGFDEMKMKKITADVAIKNLNSVRILEKFMNPVKEFFNDSDNCVDRRYEVYLKDWK